MASEEMQGVPQAPPNDQQNVMPNIAAQPPQNLQNPLDNFLACQWTGCGERCQSPEALYVGIYQTVHMTMCDIENKG